MTKIDLEQLAEEIRGMNRHHVLYRLLRDELSKLGFWKQKPRGNPLEGFKAMKDIMKNRPK